MDEPIEIAQLEKPGRVIGCADYVFRIMDRRKRFRPSALAE